MIDKNLQIKNIEYKGKMVELEQLPNGKWKIPEFMRELDGSFGGCQLKPAVEVVIVAMKPMTENTFIDQALDNGKGVTWLGDCRIPYNKYDNEEYIPNRIGYKEGIKHKVKYGDNSECVGGGFGISNISRDALNKDGRFPANLLVSDDVLNDGNIIKGGKVKPYNRKKTSDRNFVGDNMTGYFDTDSGSFSRYFDLDKWAEKSGRFPANLLVSDDVLNDGKISKSGTGAIRKNTKCDGSVNFMSGTKEMKMLEYNDSGSFSRYFDLDKWFKTNLPESVQKTYPYLIIPKASKGEKNLGLEHLENKLLGQSGGAQQALKKGDTEYLQKNHIGLNKIKVVKNNHPTVKPLKLFAYLITMGSRECDTVLDPFLGSGTAGIAAKLLNRNFIGIELSKEYIDIAEPRLDAYEEYRRFIIEKPKEDHFSSDKQKNKPIQKSIDKFF